MSALDTTTGSFSDMFPANGNPLVMYVEVNGVPRGPSTDPYLQNRKYAVMFTRHLAINDKDPVLTIVGSVPKEFRIDQTSTWASPWGGGLMGKGFAGDLMAVLKGNRLLTQSLSLQVWQGAADDTSFSVSFDLVAYTSAELDVMGPLRDLLSLAMPSLDKSGFLLSPGATVRPEFLETIGGTLGTLVGQGAAAVATGVSTTAKLGYEALKKGELMSNGLTSAVGAGADVAYKGLTEAVADSRLATKTFIEAGMENLIQVDIGDWFTMNNVVITDVNHTLSPQLPGPDGGVMYANVTVAFRPMFALTSSDLTHLLRGRSTA